MHADYYQSTLYPLKDKVLKIVGDFSADFYLTGGAALSRAYLFHRYSDDLDFFVNGVNDFKSRVNSLIRVFSESGLKFNTSVADEGFARIFIIEGDSTLKLDFVKYSFPETRIHYTLNVKPKEVKIYRFENQF
ncbi:MAG: nucleotidyl transferase AbiEii/AbiGii toxin family protein [Bacteroidia bacterium]|nr:nucleotidyl transferase AbiEii/AbiGii toxin family protein [Bacteroidia bacterium]